MRRPNVLQKLVGGAALVLALLVSSGASHAADPKAPASTAAQRQARSDAGAKAFLTGKYDEALHIFSELYIDSDGRPEYLRNIGRCQQKLKQYDLAIDTFRDYLRRMKKISAEERREVEGFISEIETARLNQASSGTTPPPAPVEKPPEKAPEKAPVVTPPPPAPAPAPVVATPPPAPAPQPASPPPIYTSPAPASGAAGYPPGPHQPYAYPVQPGYQAQTYQATAPAPSSTLTTTPAPPPAARRRTSPAKVLGVVGIITGGVLLAGAVVALSASQSTYDAAKNGGCPNTSSYCSTEADKVDLFNTASKILFVSGGVLGALGVTLVVVAPSSTPSNETKIGLGFTGRF
jgi:hypothetical protein